MVHAIEPLRTHSLINSPLKGFHVIFILNFLLSNMGDSIVSDHFENKNSLLLGPTSKHSTDFFFQVKRDHKDWRFEDF